MSTQSVDFPARRSAMVAEQLAARDIKNPAVLAAMGDVPREEFIPKALAAEAYDDNPLPIGHGQTISQPYIVAKMIQAVRPQPTDKALEIGTGSGYGAAVLGRLVESVVTVERLPALAAAAAEKLHRLGVTNVTVVVGDGSLGHAAGAPYDAIIVTACGPEVPQALRDQLAPGGRLVIPVGEVFSSQTLNLLERGADGPIKETVIDYVRFVPLIGAAGWDNG